MIPKYLNEILNSCGAIVLIGTGRSGKTATAHHITQHTTKPIFALEYPQKNFEYLPSNWSTIKKEEVFNLKDCIIFVDDSALFASSRNFNSKWSKKWIQFQTIISHKNITVIFIVQSTNLLDIGILRSQRMAILYKYSDSVNILYEREEFKQIATLSNQIIAKAKSQHFNVHPKSWVYDLELKQIWNHPLPHYWNDYLSTPYREYIIQEEVKS
jgi:GTPase SAR1 family protein